MIRSALLAGGCLCVLAPMAAASFVLTPEAASFLGGSEAHPVVVAQRPAEPHTSFHTQTGYEPEYDIRTDAVIIYDTEKEKYTSWQARGYDTQTMYCFREDQAYLDAHPGAGQTNARGEVIKVGEGRCYYMVPTRERIAKAVAYFDTAIENGSTAVVPEEPEYFVDAGYSAAFKEAWREHYGEPWRDPASSLEARWKSETLKADMEFRMIDAILTSAEKKKPSVKRMVAIHSPLHYYGSRIIFPYHRMVTETPLQEVIAQIWTGTARLPTIMDGIEAERTFEWSYLEYSSMYQLTRDTGKRLWFFMDPLEDNLDRGIEDYQVNYEKTLISCLQFPAVDEYEVMPWPTRIYGKVPDWFTTKMGAIVNMLNDMHTQQGAEIYAGTPGIATFVSDSMGWQLGDPHPGDLTGFQGLTLPLISRGIPVQVATFERSAEPDYLRAFRVLLLSYDVLKPMDPACHEALDAWVRAGGTLILFGGTDPYDALDEWWQRAGFSSAQDHLLQRLGVAATRLPAVRPWFWGSRAARVEPSPLPETFKIPARYIITPHRAESGVLYDLGKPDSDLVIEQRVGAGHVIVAGVTPAYFGSSPEAGALLRSLVQRGCERAGVAYRETGYMGIRRGKYVALQSYTEPFPLRGVYVDVVGRDFPVLTDPVIPAGGRAMLAEVTPAIRGDIPRILISSDRIEARVEAPQLTSMCLTGPLKTRGLARVATAGRTPAQVSAIDSQGRPHPVTVSEDASSLLIGYDSLPDGCSVKILWQEKPASASASTSPLAPAAPAISPERILVF